MDVLALVVMLGMRMFMTVSAVILMSLVVRMIVSVFMTMLVSVAIPLLEVLLAGQVLLPMGVNVYLGGADPAAMHPRNFEAGANVQVCDCFL